MTIVTAQGAAQPSPPSPRTTRIVGYVTAYMFATAGALFVYAPALEPYVDETSMAGARALTSPAWLHSHTGGIFGFIHLCVALAGLRFLPAIARSSASWIATGLAFVAMALILPYLGGEAYGLNAIGHVALQTNDPVDLQVASTFRYGLVQASLFGVGNLFLSGAGIALLVSTWRARRLIQYGALVLCIGLMTYLPTYWAPLPARLVHGLLVMTGSVMLALACWQAARGTADGADRPVT